MKKDVVPAIIIAVMCAAAYFLTTHALKCWMLVHSAHAV